jgi:hypothetical protein
MKSRGNDLLDHVESHCSVSSVLLSSEECHLRYLRQYVTMGLNFSSCPARFAKGASCRPLSFTGIVSPMFCGVAVEWMCATEQQRGGRCHAGSWDG